MNGGSKRIGKPARRDRTVTCALMIGGVASELVMVDVNSEKALGDAQWTSIISFRLRGQRRSRREVTAILQVHTPL